MMVQPLHTQTVVHVTFVTQHRYGHMNSTRLTHLKFLQNSQGQSHRNKMSISLKFKRYQVVRKRDLFGTMHAICVLA